MILMIYGMNCGIIIKIIAITDTDKSDIKGPVINENGNKIKSILGIFSKKKFFFSINLINLFNYNKINY